MSNERKGLTVSLKDIMESNLRKDGTRRWGETPQLMLAMHPRKLYELTPTNGLYREPWNVQCMVPEPCTFQGIMLAHGEWRVHGIYLMTIPERPLVEWTGGGEILSRFRLPPGKGPIPLRPGHVLRLDISDPYPERERTLLGCFIC